MKHLTLLLSIPFLLTLSDLEAQRKLNDRDMIGTWKLVINIEEGIEEARNDLDENEDNFIASMILGSVEGLITSILDEVEIFMDFQKEGQLKIIINAFDEKEIEYSNWNINNQGKLVIDDNDNTDVDHWMLEDDILVGYDEDGQKNHVYMVKII